MFSQNNYPLELNNSDWRLIYYSFDGAGQNFTYTETQDYGFSYSIGAVDSTNREYFYVESPDFKIEAIGHVNNGFVWQDNTSEKVYFKKYNSSSIYGIDSLDYLIYDFSQQVGDTVISALIQDQLNYVIQSIDTVVLEGVARKRITSVSEYQKVLELVTGIGSYYGVLYDLYDLGVESGVQLSCMTSDSITIYNDQYEGCSYVLGINKVEESNLNVYPNPNNGTFNINVSIKDVFYVLNSLGQVVSTIDNRTNSIGLFEIKIDEPGIYFLVASENKFIKEKIIVINNSPDGN